MFPQFGRNLTLAFCLALQVTVAACLACPCRQAEGGNPASAASRETTDAEKTGCWLCRVQPEARPTYRQPLSERQIRLPATTTLGAIHYVPGVRAQTAASLPAATLPPPDVPELQVFLE